LVVITAVHGGLDAATHRADVRAAARNGARVGQTSTARLRDFTHHNGAPIASLSPRPETSAP
jgi:hypothetical protein